MNSMAVFDDSFKFKIITRKTIVSTQNFNFSFVRCWMTGSTGDLRKLWIDFEWAKSVELSVIQGLGGF